MPGELGPTLAGASTPVDLCVGARAGGRCTWVGVKVSRSAGRDEKAAQDTGQGCVPGWLQEPEAGRRGQRLPSLVLGGCARWEEGAEGGQRTPLIIQDVWQGPGGRGSCRSDT